MIPAVHPRGANVGGLLRYLFGPGKREEHTDAHLVAAWNDAGSLADLEPPTAGNGRRDVRGLTELLEQPVSLGRNPPRKTVWHCSIRTHPTDRTLSDGQWQRIAAEVMAAVGLAPHGDDRAVRWVAVRHAADHIHVVATLVRQDRRTAWTTHDYRKAQQACRDLEERYGLFRVAPPGSGSRQWPRPAELNKAARVGPTVVPARERLRREVRAVAAVAGDEREFFARLAAAEVLVKLRQSSVVPGQVTGYAVGLAGHTTGSGETIWYSGGRLAADLTLPKLRIRWAGGRQEPPIGSAAARLAALGMVPPSGETYRRAAEAARQAGEALRTGADPAEAADIAHAAADLLASTAHGWERRRGGPLTRAADAFDRAAYERRGPALVRHVPHAGRLRSVARLIAVMGMTARDSDTATVLHLIHALVGLADALADLRDAQHRLHQAQAARAAATFLRSYQPPPPGAAGPGPVPMAVRRDSHPVAPRRSARRA